MPVMHEYVNSQFKRLSKIWLLVVIFDIIAKIIRFRFLKKETMRIQPERKINIMGKTIGGSKPLICAPLVAKTKRDLLHEAKELLRLTPDILEWRVDGFNQAKMIDKSLLALSELRGQVKSIPLILTCRIDTEGGIQKINRDIRLNLILESIKTGLLDMVDIELVNDAAFIGLILDNAKQHNVKVILSYHDFEKTPDENFIFDRLFHAQNLGADITKVAVMPNGIKDVLVLLNATFRARTKGIKIPLVTISMGAKGIVTRLTGGLFGSDITFAVGKNASAPGQIPIDDLRRTLALLYQS
jgi:3-dehydroquinate dehydratase-1